MPKFVVAVYNRGQFEGNYILAGKTKKDVTKKAGEMFPNATRIVVGAEVEKGWQDEPNAFAKMKLMMADRTKAIDALKLVLQTKNKDQIIDVFCEDLDLTALRKLVKIHAIKDDE